MKIKESIAWTAFLAVMAIIMFPSCSDEHEAGILEITNNEIILQAEGDPVQVEVKSNTEWRIDFVESTLVLYGYTWSPVIKNLFHCDL
ncbi:hypothetical protein NXW74_12230 [Bacteroides ovatus]|nr:hypothetical protein NXW74_12230 [Bacteroides ovatus]